MPRRRPRQRQGLRGVQYRLWRPTAIGAAFEAARIERGADLLEFDVKRIVELAVKSVKAFEKPAPLVKMRELTHPDTQVIILQHGRLGLLGFVAFRFELAGGIDSCFIYQIAVVECQRSLAVGRRLLDMVKVKAQQAGRTALALQVAVANARARQFYESAGYIEIPSLPEIPSPRFVVLWHIIHAGTGNQAATSCGGCGWGHATADADCSSHGTAPRAAGERHDEMRLEFPMETRPMTH